MGKFLITIIIVVGCIIFRVIWDDKNKNVDVIRELRESLDDITVDKSIEKFIWNCIDNEDIGKYIDAITILNYESFKEYWISQKYMEISNKIGKDGLNWLSLTNDNLTKEQVLSQIRIALEGKMSDIKLSKAYTDYIVSAYEESKKIEADEVKYHSSFGAEDSSDPELHPVEAKTGASEDEEIVEKSVEDLLSTGTVEDVED